MTAEKLWKWFKHKNHPNDIFTIYEEGLRLPESEKNKLIELGVGDSIDMQYITAVEMREKGTWEAYIKRWEQNKNKTGEDILREYMNERGLTFPGKVE